MMLAAQFLSRLRVLAEELRRCQTALGQHTLLLNSTLGPAAEPKRLLSTGCHQRAKHRSVAGKKPELSEKKLTRYFVDHRRVRVVAGAGGNGACCFHSEPRKEYGGPDGGDGGNGGHIILKADPRVKSLSTVTPLYKGSNGERGRSDNCFGRNGDSIYIRVPLGTLVKEEGKLLADLSKPGDEFLAAHGGVGGKGNRFFLSNENRAPMMATPGEPGEERILHLELKTMAHAGMVGFPNAGKSSLLRLLSNARPAVAAYPFTTLNPHVGVIKYRDYVQIAVADIPGIIDGAHQNRGLGFAFLRHIERCRILLFVLDLSHKEPWAQLESLRYELEQYDKDLLGRPQVIVANKLDLPVAQETLQRLRQETDSKVIGVSALTGENAEELILHLRELYDGHSQHSSNALAAW
ncbi:mitochondrial ribosome-associated GTPase 2 L homeolog [Xenopus laevis]|nr:mitochondrial ribosome-associated GTPase 2 L homeolog [Xenopus laevis]AAH99033.1 Gtpbp5 protein [Xenopus laevis]